jgi:3-oxoacyl-[acyl-carrier protein] reductase
MSADLKGKKVLVTGASSGIGLATAEAESMVAASHSNVRRSGLPRLAPEVRVNAVAPGHVDTAWTRNWPAETRKEAADRAVLKRICRPEDIADVILFLCVGTPMITGQTVVVDGGSRSEVGRGRWLLVVGC